jgi:RNA recognition motif-containing protein
MPSDEEAQSSIDALNGQQLDGRPLTVNEAQARPPRSGGGGGGRGGGGGFGGGGGGRGPRW